MQLAGRVADHVVDNIVGQGLERAFDVAVGFPAEVVLDDPSMASRLRLVAAVMAFRSKRI